MAYTLSFHKEITSKDEKIGDVMRILITSFSYPPYHYESGVGNVAKNLVDILSKKNEVFVVSAKPFRKAYNSEKNVFRVSIFHVPYLMFAEGLQFRSRSLKVAEQLFKKYDFDVFHDNQGNGVKIGEFIKEKNLNIKTIEHSHGGYIPFEELGAKKYIAKILMHVNAKILHTDFKYDKYIAVSKWHKEELIQQGIDKNKISVLYNPIDTTRYAGSRSR